MWRQEVKTIRILSETPNVSSLHCHDCEDLLLFFVSGSLCALCFGPLAGLSKARFHFA